MVLDILTEWSPMIFVSDAYQNAEL
jgi:hypothetical protein